MPIGADIGTSNIVIARKNAGGDDEFIRERDAFMRVQNRDFLESMLEESEAFYIKNGDDLFVIGEDAVKFAAVFDSFKDKRDVVRTALQRPMAKGVLNPDEEDAEVMLRVVIEALAKEAKYDGEVAAVTCPAAPLDNDFDTIMHEAIIRRIFESLGYVVKILNEALCIIYASNPVIESPDGTKDNFSGIGISFGAGMVNTVFAFKGVPLVEYSVSRSGDWIDESVAKQLRMSPTQVCVHKERTLDFENVDPSDRTARALEIYYESLIKYVVENFKDEFAKTGKTIYDPVEIVIAGGTAMPNGFAKKFEDVLRGIDMPFPVKTVRLADSRDQILANVARGAMIAATAEEAKLKKERQEAAVAKTEADPPQKTAEERKKEDSENSNELTKLLGLDGKE